MPFNIKKIVLFMQKVTDRFRSSKPPPPPKLESLPSNLYRSIDRLPMVNFIECLCDKNLRALIISGDAAAAELEETWIKILAQYNDLLQSEIDSRWKLIRDVHRTEHHLFLLDKCIEFLRIRYSESIAESLRRLGYNFRPESHEPAKYEALLISASQKSKTKYIYLKQLVEKLKEVIEETADQMPTKEDFENRLLEFEHMQGTTYSMETITVQKFALMQKKYDARVKELEKQQVQQTSKVKR
jgi:hypothetical protein